jgi:hypothetical protein
LKEHENRPNQAKIMNLHEFRKTDPTLYIKSTRSAVLQHGRPDFSGAPALAPYREGLSEMKGKQKSPLEGLCCLRNKVPNWLCGLAAFYPPRF